MSMDRQHSEPLSVQVDDSEAQSEEIDNETTAQASQNITIPGHAGSNGDDILEMSATQVTAAGSQGPPPEAVIDLTVDERPQAGLYSLTRFNQRIPKTEVYSRLRSKYSKLYKRQAGIAMPDPRLKQRLEDIAGSVLTKPIGYVIDRDQKAWSQELRLQKRALAGELQILETFMEEKVQRADYRRAFRRNLVRDAQAKVNKIEEDLKLREKLIEEMKIFAKQD